MTTINNICVYCGSRNPGKKYGDIARSVGNVIGSAGKGLVYGGSRSGLMGIVADSVLKTGQSAVGVITSYIQDREEKHDDLTEMIVVETMHERKAIMVDRADAFVILPGGLGTLDEAFEIITWKQLGLHDKPIVLINFDGYWQKMIEMIKNIVASGFAEPEDVNLFHILEGTDKLIETINKDPASKQTTHSEWL